MGLMDRMMDSMIKNMSVEQKEEMMLKMMPTMMEGIDINKMMPDMMTAMGSLTTVTGIVVFISKALNDDELKEELGELLHVLREKMSELPEMMSFPSAEATIAVTGSTSPATVCDGASGRFHHLIVPSALAETSSFPNGWNARRRIGPAGSEMAPSRLPSAVFHS